MQCKKKQRTLKRRIYNAVSLSILVTVFLFGSIVVFLSAKIFRTEALFWSNHFAYSIARDINSEYFRKQLGISDLNQLEPNEPKAHAWLKNLDESWKSTLFLSNSKTLEELHEGFHHAVNNCSQPDEFLRLLSIQDMIQLQINLGNRVIYTNTDPQSLISAVVRENEPEQDQHKAFHRLKSYFTVRSSYPLYNNDEVIIGWVWARTNPTFTVMLFMGIVFGIITVAIVSLLIARMISYFFTLPITVPINKLEAKFRALAAGDYSSTVNAQLDVNNCLKEIQSMSESTNIIIGKMNETNKLLASQNELLENQRDELEVQNDELIKSQRQIQEAQTMLVHSERMASVGQLTAAITHEINTPLGAIHSNSQIGEMLITQLTQYVTDTCDEDVNHLVSQLREANNISLMACNRVTEIIRSLKSFSRMDQAEFQEADLNEGLRSVLVLTSNLWKRKITIHESYGNLPPIKCYPGMLNQVFMNLVVNAIQAIEDKGVIHIHTYLEGDWVRISIRDNGCGIPKEHLERIFESGFTTKCQSRGMGLGLSICKSIIQKHDGEIAVDSQVGEGTEFIVSLPIKQNAQVG